MNLEQYKLHAEVEEQHWWFRARRKIMLRLVREVLPESKDTVIVDFGCGTGGNIAALAPYYSCIGVDLSPEAIEFARKRFPEVFFCCGSATIHAAELGKRAHLFLLMDVLEHVADDREFLSELIVHLRPGAYLLLTVPAGMALWTQHDVSFGHYRRYDLSSLQRLWEALPVTVRLVSYYNTYLYPVVRVLRALGRFRGATWGAAGTDIKRTSWPINRFFETIFAMEAHTLLAILQGKRRRGFPFGVSLIALLQREEK